VFKLLKNISVYSFGNLLSKGVMFLLLPLYTRVLQPADYGKLELVYLIGSILSMLYGLRVELGYNRIYFSSTDAAFRKSLFATGQLFSLCCGIVLSLLIFSNTGWFASVIFEFPEGALYLRLIAIVTTLEVLTHIPMNNLRIRHKAKRYVAFNVIRLILVTSLTVYFVAFMRIGVTGVLLAKIIGDITVLALLQYETRKEYSMAFVADQLKMMLAFSVFLIPSNLSALVLNMSNRYFLQEYQTLEDVGLYSLGAKLAGIIPFLFTEPVKQAFGPYLFEQINEPAKCKSTLADFSRVFFVGLAIVALAISMFSRELIEVMSDISYAGSHNVVFVLSVSYLFLGLSGIIVMGIHITKKTWVIAMIWPVSAASNILFNIWLIPMYGRMGAAYATLFSVVVIFFSYLVALRRLYPVRLNYFSFLKVFVLMIIFNYIAHLIQAPLVTSIIIKVFLFIGFLSSLYFTRVFTKHELFLFKSMLKTKKK
jgi:O-antigen/teichoic acid export membrane protein